ncbi:MAG: hypothetical protein M4579_003588 [Chaenotheca gracillima]|nr:MAG: hypothetical protein M4579_003588 [Chaenotheca gracillima]
MNSSSAQIAAVKAVQAQFNAPPVIPIWKRQELDQKDPGARGPIWISRTSFPAPGKPGEAEYDVRRAVLDVVEDLAEETNMDLSFARSSATVANVKAEWVGRRLGVDDAKAPEPEISERANYEALMGDVGNEVTIFYVHGGAFYSGSPVTVRAATSKLATLTQGRCLSVGYRLSPQNAFPAALIDVFIAYLSLLYPPPGAYHSPVPASKIVFAGDSCGGNLCLGLIQVILCLRRLQSASTPTVSFHGRDVEIPMPAGFSSLSTWCDFSHAMPSMKTNGEYDILVSLQPVLLPDFPPEDAWPTKPPRGDIYCDSAMLAHPLVSPVAARTWQGAPPMWFASGDERAADAQKMVASQAAQQGVTVLYEQYQAMPHVFALFLSKLPQSMRCWRHWAQICLSFAEGTPLKTHGEFVELPGTSARHVEVEKMMPLHFEEALKRIKQNAMSRPPWIGEKTPKPSL